MFETETMAELCLKQGLILDALAIYRRLLASSPDEGTRARHTRRIAELEARDHSRSARHGRSDSDPDAAPPAPVPATDIQAHHDQRQVTFAWRLPLGTPAPALQILVLRRDPTGIATERRTVRLPDAQGTLTLPIAGVYQLRAAAGNLDGDRFVPLIRLDPPDE
jgi:hypothetical protein